MVYVGNKTIFIQITVKKFRSITFHNYRYTLLSFTDGSLMWYNLRAAYHLWYNEFYINTSFVISSRQHRSEVHTWSVNVYHHTQPNLKYTCTTGIAHTIRPTRVYYLNRLLDRRSVDCGLCFCDPVRGGGMFRLGKNLLLIINVIIFIYFFKRRVCCGGDGGSYGGMWARKVLGNRAVLLYKQHP